jgi:ketosteroid isomerase-like protein
MSLEERVRSLEERERVLETLHAYSHSIDRGDEEGWLECFTEDAVFEVRSQIPDYPIQRHQGTDALGAFIASHTKPPEVQHKHLYVDPQITIGGDRARAVGYFVHLLDRDHKPAIVSYGRYLDELVRGEDGHWRFVERVSEVHASEGSAAASFGGPPRASS